VAGFTFLDLYAVGVGGLFAVSAFAVMAIAAGHFDFCVILMFFMIESGWFWFFCCVDCGLEHHLGRAFVGFGHGGINSGESGKKCKSGKTYNGFFEHVSFSPSIEFVT
jgi:hypothetical protein